MEVLLLFYWMNNEQIIVMSDTYLEYIVVISVVLVFLLFLFVVYSCIYTVNRLNKNQIYIVR